MQPSLASSVVHVLVASGLGRKLDASDALYFTGSSVVTWLVAASYCANRTDAISFCDYLKRAGVLVPALAGADGLATPVDSDADFAIVNVDDGSGGAANTSSGGIVATTAHGARDARTNVPRALSNNERDLAAVAPAVTISVPLTETRAAEAASGVHTSYGVRVALGAGGGAAWASEPWTVWRRYRQFEALHQALTARERDLLRCGLVAPSPPPSGDSGRQAPSALVGSSPPRASLSRLPELPGKGHGWGVGAVASALGVGASSLSRSFVDDRRQRLEAYLRGVAQLPWAWTVDEWIAFLDTDTRPLAAHVNLARLVASQRLLTYMTNATARRQAELERRLEGTHAGVAGLASRLDRLERLVLGGAQPAGAQGRESPEPAAHGHHAAGCQPPASPPAAEAHAGRPRGTSGAAAAAADAGKVTGADVVGNPMASARAYVAEFATGVGAAPRNAPAQAAHAVPAVDAPPGFRSATVRLAADMTSADAAALLDWAFGAPGEPRPRDESGRPDRAAACERVSQADVLDHKAAIAVGSRRRAAAPGPGDTTDAPTRRKGGSKAERDPADTERDLAGPVPEAVPTEQNLATAHAGGPRPTPPPDVSAVMHRVDELVGRLQPTQAAEAKREAVLALVRGLVRQAVGADVTATGSSATKVYLPTGDVDVTVFLGGMAGGPAGAPAGSSPGGGDSDWFVRVHEVLCTASVTGGLALPVTDVSFVNAEVRLVRCRVGGLDVDISANATNALAGACLVEAFDRWVGCDHLFKRSVLLAKAWAAADSGAFTTDAAPIIGGGAGGMSSHALAVLMMAVFNCHARVITHPLHALAALFEEIASTPLGSTLWAVNGPRHLFMDAAAARDLHRPAAPRFLSADRLRPFRLYAAACAGDAAALDAPLDARNCAIVDPVAAWNNLGRSVSRRGAAALSESMAAGRDRMRALLRLAREASEGARPIEDALACCDAFFARTAAALAAGPTPAPSSVDEGATSDPLLGDAAALNASMRYSGALLCGLATATGLAALTAQLLARLGPLPVGEVGKLLLDATASGGASAAGSMSAGGAPAGLPLLVKEDFGGLKKFLAAHPRFFVLGDEHPFNPTVRLAW